MPQGFDPYHQWLGIPPAQQPPNHYRLLGLELFESDPDVIDQAASRQMVHIRTYARGEHAAASQQILNELAAARVCLLNPKSQAAYDHALHASMLMSPAELDTLEPLASDRGLLKLEEIVAETAPLHSPATLDSYAGGPLVGRSGFQDPRRRLALLACGLGAGLIVLFLAAVIVGNRQVARQAPNVTPPDLKAPPHPVATSHASPPDAPLPSKPAIDDKLPAAAPPIAQAPAPTSGPGKPLETPPVADRPIPATASSNATDSNAAAAGATPGVQEPPALPLENLIESIERSVVVVETGDALGSGFVLDQLGTIVTNHHVIEGASAARVRFRDGSTARVQGTLALDEARDLALLQIDQPAATLKPIPLAKAARKGERVFAFGAPKGLDFSVSEGIVSGLRLGEELNRSLPQSVMAPAVHWVQTTAAISSGNSGGPLIDARGCLVGVNTMILFPGSSQSLNFAVAASEIEAIYNRASRQVRPLPQNPAPAAMAGSRPPASPRVWLVRMPGDETLSSNLLELNVRETWNAVFRRRTAVALVQSDKYQLAAECDPASKRLDGLLTVVFPTGQPKLHASYSDNKREGQLIAWNEFGEAVYYEQCRNDKVHEVCCLFKNNQPWLIEQYDRFDRVAIHRLANNEIAATHHDEQEAAQDPQTQKALQALQQTREQLERDEVELKRHVRDYVDDVRRQLAARKSVVGRDAILSAMQQRNSANQAAMQSYSAQARRGFLP